MIEECMPPAALVVSEHEAPGWRQTGYVSLSLVGDPDEAFALRAGDGVFTDTGRRWIVTATRMWSRREIRERLGVEGRAE